MEYRPCAVVSSRSVTINTYHPCYYEQRSSSKISSMVSQATTVLVHKTDPEGPFYGHLIYAMISGPI